jgi:putative dimethyl sulfoxide reductase chaperone
MSLDAAIDMNPGPELRDVITEDPDSLVPRAETYLCLARAFLPPATPGMLEALRHDLLDDLTDLHAELPISAAIPTRIEALRAALTDITDDQALLREYSRLFLTPPAPAMLNLGFYLDGGIMGGSPRQMEAYYQRHGLERDPSFRDLPDHITLNLQFLAWVFAAAAESAPGNHGDLQQGLHDARDLIARYTLPGVRSLIGKMGPAIAELGLGPTYTELAGILADVLKRDLAFLSERLPAPALRESTAGAEPEPKIPVESEPDVRLACRLCGSAFVAGEALAGMIARLQAQGLTTEHLAVCPDCRTDTMGMRPLTPPSLKR